MGKISVHDKPIIKNRNKREKVGIKEPIYMNFHLKDCLGVNFIAA